MSVREQATWMLLAGIFAVDLVLPTGIAAGSLYVLPVLMASRCARPRRPLLVAVAASALTILGAFVPWPEGSAAVIQIAFANRILGLVAIWSVAWVGVVALRRERLAHDRELRLRTLVEATPDLILSVDATGRIETANAAAARTFGRPATELSGLDLSGLLRSPSMSYDGSVVADAASLIADGRSGSGLAIIPLGEQPRTIRWTVRPLSEAGRRLAVGHDLTDLLAAQERAVRSERLAAIGQTLATISHEAKNELLGLRFGLEQLTRSWDDRDEAADLIAEMLESQGRLWTLFEDVRGYAAPIRLKLEKVSLPEVWRRAARSLDAKGARFTLAEDFDPENCESVIDAFRMEQIFRNLFENSIAACGESARIEVQCRCGMWRGEPAMLVIVRDSGPGVPEELRDRLFEPFFTTKPHGTGLGLSVCRRVIDAHHGEMALLTSGSGAAFQITLPCSACGIERVPDDVDDAEPVRLS
jgi:signal transduction histidine kinase